MGSLAFRLMIVSLNEIETTVLKAARGAGMEWGLAEEAARAASSLARLGLAWETPLLGVLESAPWRTPPVLDGMRLRPGSADAWLCPIRSGAFISDLGEDAPAIIERVLFPILLLPFAAPRQGELAREPARELAWDGVTVRLEAGTVAIAPPRARSLDAARADEVALRPARIARKGEAPQRGLPAGVVVAAGRWAELQGYEARTYVPASTKSRLRGAGPASSDND
ncbi:MAG: DUF3726 domain-containing protein [Hyphomicrobiales bacterium]